jgi:hypothetical protein
MKWYTCILILILPVMVHAQPGAAAIEQALFDLPGVSFKKISNPGDPYLRYDLSIKQPVDHWHPEKGFFYQRVILNHRGFQNPTVMETQGYQVRTADRNEIDKILTANNLNIEHRFFAGSTPDPVQWEYLNEEQATADLHAINQLFRTIYKGKWISTGISKGGSTTIYYKYFYPDDVDLAIPYVAPMDDSQEDQRIYAFFDTIGTPDCRKKITQLQLYLLKHENEAIEKLKWYSKGAGLHYDYTGNIGKSFELAVLEYPFSFWQYYNNSCDSIPVNNSLDTYLDELLKVSNISNFADEGLKPYESHYYQASTQTGYYGYNIAPFKRYIKYFTENPSASFPPKSATLKPFDAGLNLKVLKWLEEKGNNILYIYGGADTWTSAGIIVSNKVNAKKYVIPGANHATARVKNMDPDMQRAFFEDIQRMTGIEAKMPKP